MTKVPFLILIGLSGAGKSVAMKCLEDLGYLCIDNLPCELIGDYAKLISQKTPTKVALALHNTKERNQLEEVLEHLPQYGFEPEILYLEASEAVLLKRYSETRRLHPLAEGQGILQAIRQEREVLHPLKSLSKRSINTSKLSPHELMARLRQLYGTIEQNKITIHLVSFGFKHGSPPDADYCFDVRFLPNPYYQEELRYLTGLEKAVSSYVLSQKEAQHFLEHCQQLLDLVFPLFFEGGRHLITVAIGCTGGQHRSTSIVEKLREYYETLGYPVSVEHRHLKKREAIPR